MTEIEFQNRYGMSSKRCRKLMERLREIVNEQVRDAITHADYYMDPTAYCEEDYLKERFGDDCFEKDDEADGYPNLYDYGKQNSAEAVFMDFISANTMYGSHGSACDACYLMDLHWEE